MTSAVLSAPVRETGVRSSSNTFPADQPFSPSIDDAELIERFLPMVRSIVERIRINLPSHVEADELYSVGITGLIAAVRNFDHSRGRTFAGYVSVRVRGAILDELRRLDWCPRRTRAKGRRMREAVSELEQTLGREPTEREIQKELGLSSREYYRLLDEIRPVTFLALDNSGSNGNDDEGALLHETIPDRGISDVREDLENEELLDLVSARIDELPEVQRKVLAMYYFEGMRLAEIAAVFGLTESRICQIHSQAILVLRAFVHRVREQ